MVSIPSADWQAQASVADVIHWVADQFDAADLSFGHGTANALDEAAWLVSHALGAAADLSDVGPQRLLTASEFAKVLELTERRIAERLPLAYLINEAWFAGLRFYVDRRVIIPRSPIAELIHEHFAPWIDEKRVQRVLDLCTGSGCIALACAYAFPKAKVDATDISADALAVAKINIDNHNLDERVKLLQSNLFTDVDGVYDLIVSNPPYVDAADMAGLTEEYRHEPELALAAGQHGLDLVYRMLPEAAAYLSPHGILVVEVGNSAEALVHLLPNVPFTWLEFEFGGEGVFLLHRDELMAHHDEFISLRDSQVVQG